jgi:hypothetical protein
LSRYPLRQANRARPWFPRFPWLSVKAAGRSLLWSMSVIRTQFLTAEPSNTLLERKRQMAEKVMVDKKTK